MRRGQGTAPASTHNRRLAENTSFVGISTIGGKRKKEIIGSRSLRPRLKGSSEESQSGNETLQTPSIQGVHLRKGEFSCLPEEKGTGKEQKDRRTQIWVDSPSNRPFWGRARGKEGRLAPIKTAMKNELRFTPGKKKYIEDARGFKKESAED